MLSNTFKYADDAMRTGLFLRRLARTDRGELLTAGVIRRCSSSGVGIT
jgi:hypothetical protein